MGADLIVVPAPILDDDPCLQAITKPLHGQTLVTEFAVKAFIGAVLPRLAGLNQNGTQVFIRRPLQQLCADELRTIVTAKIGWCAVQADQTAQDLNDATGTNAARHINGQALPGVLIHHGQTLQGLPVGTGVKDEVIAPHAISPDGQTRPSNGPRREAKKCRKSLGSPLFLHFSQATIFLLCLSISRNCPEMGLTKPNA